MATIDNWGIIQKVIDDPDYDPDVVQIVTYINAWGNRTYAVLSQQDLNQGRYRDNPPYVNYPDIIWKRGGPQLRDKDGYPL